MPLSLLLLSHRNSTMSKKTPLGLANEFRLLGLSLVGLDPKPGNSVNVQDRRFREHYGPGWNTVAKLWEALVEAEKQSESSNAVAKLKKKHLLWCLYFMKVYSVEGVGAARFGIDRKTYVKWVWVYIKKVSSLTPHFVSYFSFFNCCLL